MKWFKTEKALNTSKQVYLGKSYIWGNVNLNKLVYILIKELIYAGLENLNVFGEL